MYIFYFLFSDLYFMYRILQMALFKYQSLTKIISTLPFSSLFDP